MDLLGLGEIVRAKRELCGTEDLDVLAILPAELDFGLEVMAVDHRAVNGGCGQARRLALIAQNSFDERLVNIYFRYHPRAHDTAVFANEADARNWLDRGQPGPSLV